MHLVYFLPHPNLEIGYWNCSSFKSETLEGNLKLDFKGVQSCIGYNDGEEHHPCINDAVNIVQCPYCKYRDISKVYTRMDLTGFEHLEEQLINRPYALYLAYFGKDIIKCGVCREERLQSRIMEQGALFYIPLMKFNNANDAYDMENLIQNTFGVKNSVRNSVKLKSMKEIELGILEKKFEEIKTTPPFSEYLLKNSNITKVSYNVPLDFELSTEKIHGEILGFYSSFLIYSNNGNNFGIDMKRKIGEHFSKN